MLHVRFDELRRQKAAKENRDIPLRLISDETGLSVTTLQRVRHNDTPRGVSLQTLDVLCAYFAVESVAELIEYRPTK